MREGRGRRTLGNVVPGEVEDAEGGDLGDVAGKGGQVIIRRPQSVQAIDSKDPGRNLRQMGCSACAWVRAWVRASAQCSCKPFWASWNETQPRRVRTGGQVHLHRSNRCQRTSVEAHHAGGDTLSKRGTHAPGRVFIFGRRLALGFRGVCGSGAKPGSTGERAVGGSGAGHNPRVLATRRRVLMREVVADQDGMGKRIKCITSLQGGKKV